MEKREYLIVEELPVKFSTEEKINLSEELAEAIEKKQRLESQIKEYTDLRKPEIKKTDSQIEFQSNLIIRGYQLKDVDCRVIIDYDRCKKTIIRTDTGELVSENPLQDHELQTNLLDTPEDDGETKGRRSSRPMREII
jgi:hypothetical protein